jgi:hypothetical protein
VDGIDFDHNSKKRQAAKAENDRRLEMLRNLCQGN